MFTNNRMFIMMMMMITGETSVMKCTLLECNEPSLVIYSSREFKRGFSWMKTDQWSTSFLKAPIY